MVVTFSLFPCSLTYVEFTSTRLDGSDSTTSWKNDSSEMRSTSSIIWLSETTCWSIWRREVDAGAFLEMSSVFGEKISSSVKVIEAVELTAVLFAAEVVLFAVAVELLGDVAVAVELLGDEAVVAVLFIVSNLYAGVVPAADTF